VYFTTPLSSTICEENGDQHRIYSNGTPYLLRVSEDMVSGIGITRTFATFHHLGYVTSESEVTGEVRDRGLDCIPTGRYKIVIVRAEREPKANGARSHPRGLPSPFLLKTLDSQRRSTRRKTLNQGSHLALGDGHA
jgi:hypothetical protein